MDFHYPEIPKKDFIHEDKCCTSGLGTPTGSEACCRTKWKSSLHNWGRAKYHVKYRGHCFSQLSQFHGCKAVKNNDIRPRYLTWYLASLQICVSNCRFYNIIYLCCYPRLLCRSAWVKCSITSVCLSVWVFVCSEHNSKIKGPKVFKLGRGMTEVTCFAVERSKIKIT